jgi:hypothetical protein
MSADAVVFYGYDMIEVSGPRPGEHCEWSAGCGGLRMAAAERNVARARSRWSEGLRQSRFRSSCPRSREKHARAASRRMMLTSRSVLLTRWSARAGARPRRPSLARTTVANIGPRYLAIRPHTLGRLHGERPPAHRRCRRPFLGHLHERQDHEGRGRRTHTDFSSSSRTSECRTRTERVNPRSMEVPKHGHDHY